MLKLYFFQSNMVSGVPWKDCRFSKQADVPLFHTYFNHDLANKAL